MPVEIRLLTDIVIPPQVAFEVRIDSNAGVMALALLYALSLATARSSPLVIPSNHG
jgi:hypothetical protein